MKLQRTTLILMVLALGLGGFVYFYEIKGEPQRQAALVKQKPIFSFTKDQVQALTIKTQEQTLQFERMGQNARQKSSLSEWQMKAPNDNPASDPYVSYLLNLLVDSKSDRILSVPATQLPEYGLDKPLATVEVKLNNQQTHQLILGKPDFNNSFLYAQVDPLKSPSGQLNVLLVPLEFQYGVNRPLSEWTAKDETKKETPSPSPSASPENPKNNTSDKTPSPSPSPSPTASPSTSGKASPSPSPVNQKPDTSKKAAPSNSIKPSPSPSPVNQKTDTSKKASPSTLEKASPSPSPENQKTDTSKKAAPLPSNSIKPSPSPSPSQ
ncbi:MULTISPECIES: DUF4340 domain-containing protein [Cyanophyceae]|uniref:DUF4340 domain-containing protein n=1 Tax=Cyanophyceae TaxID=3028117 RepID=UPI001683AF46|nr:DUF4340 domain-containing protein [Trichocoleus sp. FACHB-69]MBD1931777.1 DUF4340 domain-containing protein [Trichocoleus sp. FACHB-69]